MRFIKENIKWCILIMILLIVSGVSVYATANYLVSAEQVRYTKNEEFIGVDEALDDLYSKVNSNLGKNDFPYVEGIWSASAQTISYTYTVTEDAIYIADASVVPSGASLTTTGTVIAEYSHNFGKMKIIRANVNDTISISGTNNQGNAGGYIVRVKGLDIDELITSSYNSDTTVQSTYTVTGNTEKLLIIAFATGRDRADSIQFSGRNKVSFYHQNNCYITTALLPQGVQATARATVDFFSTAQTYIFKLK